MHKSLLRLGQAKSNPNKSNLIERRQLQPLETQADSPMLTPFVSSSDTMVATSYPVTSGSPFSVFYLSPKRLSAVGLC
jgi:hypothetical protein